MATVNLGAIKFNWKGAYNNSTAYVADDVVSSGGNSYVCILASTGNAVSSGSHWSLMAQAGTNGTTVGLGTAGQVLKTNSGASATEWADASGGAWAEKVALTTVSGVTAIDLTNLTKTIKIFIQITAVQTDADSLIMRTSTNNGTSFDSGGSDYERGKVASSDQNYTPAGGGGALSRMILGSIDGGMEVDRSNFSEVTVFHPQLNSRTFVTCFATGFTTNGTTHQNFGLGIFAACRDAAQVVNAVRLMVDSSGTDTFDATYFVLESTL